jgi:diadenylate cyclase
LVLLQLEELMGGVEDDRRLVLKDYLQTTANWDLDTAMAALGELSTEAIVDLKMVSDVLKLPDDASELDATVQPRGYRLLSKIPRLPDAVTDHLIQRFGNLQKLLRATIEELDDVEGIGGVRARAIKEGLSRLAETSILDRYS